jgi:uncharacterized protein (TIGR03435 family)
MARLAMILVAVSAVGVPLVAQQPPVFEVVSIKPSPNDLAPEGIDPRPDGSVRFTRFQARTLITMAYRAEGIQRFDQIIGAPSWLSVDRFDIVAKAAGNATTQRGPSAVPAMVRSLLRDRFRLKVHSETRDLPAYRLVMARRDGGLGPELHASTAECPVANEAANTDRWCGIRAMGGVITGRGVSTGLLAANLSGYATVDRFVTDRTGLAGRYDFRLDYSPAVAQAGDAATTVGPSLFTALIEQLGLRLQPETKSVPVLVIDSVDRPTPN